MHPEQFKKVLDAQIQDCRDILGVKAQEYSTDADKLHNFKKAAHMQGVTQRQALAGMMAKHTVSIYDLCDKPEVVSVDIWREKITDHMNYLILLMAIVTEEEYAPDGARLPQPRQGD